jgi:hypothetical protein
MTKARTINLGRITREQFEQHFALDSPGYFLAKEALRAGEIATPVEQLETICLVNQLYGSVLSIHVLQALKPFSKGTEYLQKPTPEERADFFVEVVGKGRALEVLQAVTLEVRQQAKIGTGENDKATR